MNTIKIRVTKNHLEVVRRNVITSGNVGYVECDFSFDHDWDGKEKNIVLISGQDPPVTDLIKDDKYVIPVSLLTRAWADVSEKPTKLKIGVYSTEETDENGITQRITSDFVELDIIPSSYIEGAMPPPPPRPDIYQQLLANMVTGISMTKDYKLQLVAGITPIGQPLDLRPCIEGVITQMVADGFQFVKYATDEEVKDMVMEVFGASSDDVASNDEVKDMVEDIFGTDHVENFNPEETPTGPYVDVATDEEVEGVVNDIFG